MTLEDPRLSCRPESATSSITGPEGGAGPAREILSDDALAFVAALQRRFGAERQELLRARETRQALFDQGLRPDFLPQTRHVRESDWRVARPPADLLDRRVEITGPVDRKMIINALNSGARVFMADFEDSNSPTWENVVNGQVNLADAARGQISFEDEARGKRYELRSDARLATLVVRPRGLHLLERNLEVDGAAVSASLFDFGLYLFHNAAELLQRGTGPYFYIPKLESHHEARWWSKVLSWSEHELGLEHGSARVTVLIETLPAAFEMDEILFELRDHIVGLNCGRWDYIFSFIKTFRAHGGFVLPDRGTVGMDRRFLDAYSRLLVRTCHRRGAHAMGGMAAQIPVKGDEQLNALAFQKVQADKQREARAGHDGTWVAHPGLIETARAEFDRVLEGPHQVDLPLSTGPEITADDLLAVPAGAITLAGLQQNISVALRYVAAWLCGNGCVPIDHLMEDAATAEISRAQTWHWMQHGARLEDGTLIDQALVRSVFADETSRLRDELGATSFEQGRYPEAEALLADQLERDTLADFLTLEAYERLD